MTFDWWTLALQAVNVLVLAWLLARFFYRPVVAMVEQRRTQAQKMLTDADAARAEAARAAAEIAATRQGFSAERDKILAEARKEAEAARAEILKEAQERAAKLAADSQANTQRERAEMEKLMIDRAGALAVDIARRLLQRLPPSAATGAFVQSLCAEMRALSPQTRSTLASAAKNGADFEVVTAAALTEAEKALCAAALRDVAGRDVTPVYRTDPELIAGIEIRGPGIALRDSWRDDLDRVLKELTTHGGSSETP